MSLTQIGLHPTTLQVLQNLLKNERLAHAYIFYGNVQNKKEAAIEFAKAVNCPHQQLDSCSQCATCKRIEHGNHPDIFFIQPQGSSIKIDTLRKLRKKLYYQAPTGFTRFVIIEQAEKMRAEAANSVLKFLEEPPSAMVVILITEHVQSILPTIQSRCQKIRFFQSPLQQRIKRYQQRGYPAHLASISAQFDDELPLTAEEFEQLVNQAILLADRLLSDAIDEALLTALNWSQSQQLTHTINLLDVLLFWLRDIVYFQATGKVQHFSNWHPTLETQSSKQTEQFVLMAIENVMIARRLLDKAPFKPQEILEQMVLAIHRQELSQANGWQLIIL